MFIQQLLTKAERSTVQWKDRLEDQTKHEIEVKQRQEVREAKSDDDDENGVPNACSHGRVCQPLSSWAASQVAVLRASHTSLRAQKLVD